MSEWISKNLLDTIKEYMISMMDLKEDNVVQLYDNIEKMYQEATKEANELVNNYNFEEAAKIFLLLSKVVKRTRIRTYVKSGTDLSPMLLQIASTWQNQTEQILQEAVRYYSNESYKYQKNGDFLKSTEFLNKSENLEYKIKNGSLLKELDNEVSKRYLLLLSEATADLGVITSKRVVGGLMSSIRRIFKRESLDAPTGLSEAEEMTEIDEDIAIEPESSSIFSVTPDMITVANTYSPSSTDPNNFNWSIFIQTDSKTMELIESVTYTLHPTFNQPVQRISDPGQGFMLRASGWGEFQIKVEVQLKNEDIITLYHWLDLGGSTRR